MNETGDVRGPRRALDSLYGRIQRRLERLWLERWVGFPPAASWPIALDQVGLDAQERERYGPSPYGILRRVLSRREIEPDDVFIDFGCGMGRVLFEAARLPFKRVVGVDVVPDFTAVARDVLGRNRHRLRCEEVEVVTADVLDYEVPDDVTVAYFAAPFGPKTLDDVLSKLARSADSRPRVIRVIFYAPRAESPELDGHARVRLVRRGRRLIRRWAPADHLWIYEIRPQGGSAPPS